MKHSLYYIAQETTQMRLESQLGEEPLVLARVVSLLEDALDGLLDLLALSRVVDLFRGNDLLQFNIESITNCVE